MMVLQPDTPGTNADIVVFDSTSQPQAEKSGCCQFLVIWQKVLSFSVLYALFAF